MNIPTILDFDQLRKIIAEPKVNVVNMFQRFGGAEGSVFAMLNMRGQYPNASFYSLDVDLCDGAGEAYEIKTFPTFFFFKDGKTLERIEGEDGVEDALKKYCV